MKTQEKVTKTEFEYTENVKEFTGLIFHCPKCDSVFHLHIANVELEEVPKTKVSVKP